MLDSLQMQCQYDHVHHDNARIFKRREGWIGEPPLLFFLNLHILITENL